MGQQHALLPVVVAQADGIPQHLRLDGKPSVLDVAQFGKAGAVDAIAPVAKQRHQVLALQPRQRIAQRCPAEAIARGQGGHGQGLIRAQRVRQDVALESVISQICPCLPLLASLCRVALGRVNAGHGLN